MSSAPQGPLSPETMLDLSVRQFVAATAGKTPIPGGGSVAGVVGALGAALGEMSVVFTRGKKQFAAHEPQLAQLAVRLARARGMFEDLTADDAAAYSLYQEASKSADAAQSATALAAAINVPREMTAVALLVLDDLLALSGHCNRFLMSDLLAGALLAEVVVRMSDLNVRINAANVPNPAGQELRQASARDCARAAQVRGAIEQAVSKVL